MILATSRRAYRRSLAGGERLRDRNLQTAPAFLETADAVWWTGNDRSRGTIVQPSGTQTLTETYQPEPALTVSALTSIASPQVACLMFPAVLAVGQTWACRIWPQTATTNMFLIGGLVMGNGTTTSSAIVGAYNQVNNNGQLYWSCRAGTPNAFSAAETGGQLFSFWMRSPWEMRLTYSATNTFVGGIQVPGGSAPQTMGNTTSTQTPTHIGIAWTTLGTAPAVPSVQFGPIHRLV